ncbi:hypothetical protein FO440_18955 [Mucilaginibacter corticis]|uniref:Uncharacterized protein n=1 Tax=Mucilaginibacter corticis TaxID=2597670 RepID=A0A556MFN8_9SPHI|nr:hypothetical protein [Mucilaginibacter corticis]TSJ38595.1 hypothetical protein FO440_18955 [Mucilaginibacter corticis]
MKSEDKFFSGIEDTLHSYEDAYVPGAWEDFQQKRKRRRMGILFLRLGSAAAVLLLLSYVAFQLSTKAPVAVQTVSTKKKVTPTVPQQIIPVQPQQQQNITQQPAQTDPGVDRSFTAKNSSKPSTQHKEQVDPFNNIVKVQPSQNPPKQVVLSAFKNSDSTVNTIAAAGNPVKNNNQVYKPVQKPVIDSALGKPAKGIIPSDGVMANTHVDNKKYTVTGRSVYDSIMNSKVNNRVTATTKKEGKNLTYSMVVQPALGNQKINLGTGLQVAYKLSDNLYVNSGIGYSALNGTAAGTTSADAFSKTQNVNLAVSGFEVPLGLQYRTEGGFYVSAGVVGMGVVNNHLQYDQVVESTSTFATSNSQGLVQQAVRLTAEKQTQDSKEKINNYLGFYMLSIGQKKTIGNKKINFGPFMRVPFGGVSSQNVKFLQGGISLGFDF